MTPEREQRVYTIFQAVLPCDPGLRGALLDGLCAGDDEVRAALERLLIDDERASRDAFLTPPEPPGGFALTPPPRLARLVNFNIHILCPHCQNLIEMVAVPASGEVLCATCGSTFRLETESTVSMNSAVTGRRLGRFELQTCVGTGAFGSVYKAHDPQLDRIVAVKIPRAGNLPENQELDRFLREARSTAQLRHPCIVTMYEVGQEEGVPYLVSDFVDGITLADHLTAGVPSFRESARLIASVADALDHAHRQGVVHRDVKPSNIMLRGDGTPAVMDFGLAKRAAGEITVTIDGQVLGTPAYMSPEQARGESNKVDGRSDVYSLGVILYRMLVGDLPFRGNQRMLLHQVLHDDPKPPRSLNDRVPRDLETICLKAMAKETHRRYATAGDFAADLRHWLADEPITARPVGHLERSWRWCRRKPVIASLAAAVASLILVFAVGGPIVTIRETALRRETERTGYQARSEALAATESLVRAYHSQARELHHAEQAGRRDLALSLLKQTGESRSRTEELVQELGDDPDNWRSRMERFWRQQLPILRTEAVRWLAVATLQSTPAVLFPVEPVEPSNLTSEGTDLALTSDGSSLAFLRYPRDREHLGGSRIEAIDAATGEVTGGFDLGANSRGMAIAFDATGRLLVMASRVQANSDSRYGIEWRSWPTGELLASVNLSIPSKHRINRTIFSPELRHLLVISSEFGQATASMVFSVTDGQAVRNLDTTFRAQGFSASGEEIIGGTGAEIQFVSITTGEVTKRFAPIRSRLINPQVGGSTHRLDLSDDPLHSSSDPFGWETTPGRSSVYVNAETAPRLVSSPDGRWLAAIQPPQLVLQSNPPQFQLKVLIIDAASGEVRGTLPLPNNGNTYRQKGFVPLLSFDAGGRWLAAHTARQVIVGSLPEGKVLYASDLPPSQLALPIAPPASPRIGGNRLPLGMIADRTGTRLVSTLDDSEKWPLWRNDPRESEPEPALKHQIVQVWDLAWPRVRAETWYFRAAVRSVRIGANHQLIAAGGDDRQVHVWQPGGSTWSVGYPGRTAHYQSYAARTVSVPRDEVLRYGRFDPSGRVFFTRLPDRVELWDTVTGQVRWSFPTSIEAEEWNTTTGQLQRNDDHPTSIIGLSPDARMLAAYFQSEDGKRHIRVLDVERDIWTLTLPEWLGGMAFAPDGGRLVAYGNRSTGPGTVFAQTELAGRIIAEIPFGVSYGQLRWFSPSGRHAAIHGHEDQAPVLRVFDLDNGRRVGELKGVLPDLNAYSDSFGVWFNPEEDTAALMLPDGTKGSFAIWKFDQSKVIRIDSPWDSPSQASAAFMPGGKRVVLSGIKRSTQGVGQAVALEVWEIGNDSSPPRQLLAQVDLEWLPQMQMRPFLLDKETGSLVAVSSAVGKNPPTSVIWDAASGTEVERIPGRVSGITSGGRVLVVFEAQTGKYTLRSFGGVGERLTIESAIEPFVGPDGHTVIGETRDAAPSVCFWDLGSGEPRAALKGQVAVLAPREGREAGGDPVVSPDGRLLVTQNSNGPGAINLVEISTGEIVRSIPFARPPGASVRPVLDASFDPAGRRLAFNVGDRYRILDLDSDRLIALDRPGHRAAVRSVDLSRDGVLVASGSDDGTICLWHASTGEFVGDLEEGHVQIREVLFSPAADQLAATDVNGQLRVWRLNRSGQENEIEVAALPPWTDEATAIVFSSDGSLLAAGRTDGTIRLLRADNGRVERTLADRSQTGAIRSLAVADGLTLASGSDDGTVRLWDMSRETPSSRWTVGKVPIRALGFGRGRLLGITTGDDVMIWDAQKGNHLLNLEGHSGPVNCLSFSQDGRFLATCSDDQSVRIWDLDAYRSELAKLHLGW